jgi:cytosine/adenosine deaminase-related metal-dependent hydrolase
LRDRLARLHPEAVLGAAIHSVRAVPQAALARAVAGIPVDVPLHVHLSEQSAENLDSMAFTGLTPTALLEDAGALSRRTTVVHATHLTATDTEPLGRAGVFVSICPSTEADLGDGLGMPEPLDAAGARLTIGSDQNVVIDPFAEVRGVEWMERLASHRRGVFSTAALWRMGGVDGHAALNPTGSPTQKLAVGHPLDLVELDTRSPRTLGAHPEELLFSATPADVLSTIIRGRHRAVRPGEAPELDIWERLDRDG